MRVWALSQISEPPSTHAAHILISSSAMCIHSKGVKDTSECKWWSQWKSKRPSWLVSNEKDQIGHYATFVELHTRWGSGLDASRRKMQWCHFRSKIVTWLRTSVIAKSYWNLLINCTSNTFELGIVSTSHDLHRSPLSYVGANHQSSTWKKTRTSHFRGRWEGTRSNCMWPLDWFSNTLKSRSTSTYVVCHYSSLPIMYSSSIHWWNESLHCNDWLKILTSTRIGPGNDSISGARASWVCTSPGDDNF